jgi:glycosyltransferase involved in cell wall biosynthesis
MSMFLVSHRVPKRRADILGKKNFISYNGMRAGFSRISLVFFILFRVNALRVYVFGKQSKEFARWSHDLSKKTGAKVISFDGAGTSWASLRLDYLHERDGRDVLLIDANQDCPSVWQILELMQALHTYDRAGRIGTVHPAFKFGQSVCIGRGFDRETRTWTEFTDDGEAFSQSLIPRYVLVADMHSALVSSGFIESVLPSEPRVVGLSVESTFDEIIREGWLLGYRSLSYPQVVLERGHASPLSLTRNQSSWLENREVRNTDGLVKVIFVLPATTLSGGIRVVFEKVKGLRERGLLAEIWSLESPNAWDSTGVPVLRFKTYDALTVALEQEFAIKVATWWETAESVFLGSVKRGIPVQFVQEFETWFYPNSTLERAAVVASYRPEFAYLTTADFQLEELASIGRVADLVPVGYDETVYRRLNSVTREKDTIVGIGRTFFQKNFALTLNAWKDIPEPKPHFIVFGQDGSPMDHPELEYVDKPTNDQVNHIYNRGTLFIQTSRHEGFCLPIIEAMAAGCVVVTTDSHGNRGFCKDGFNCVVVEQDDVVGLSSAITRVLADESLQEYLRENAYATAKEYAWRNVLDDYSKSYLSIARRG